MNKKKFIIWQLIYFLAGVDLPLRDTNQLDFRQIQNTHFTAIRAKGKTLDQKI